jgi:manganese efflux pump family protein
MALTLIGLLAPLALDTFAVSAGLGMAGIQARDRLRVALLFTTFEAGMPVIGLVAGAGASKVAGDLAGLAAIGILLVVGGWMLLARDGDEDRSRMLGRTRGLAALGLGLGISVDELAIGFTLGLVGAPLAIAVASIALQAFVASQLGFRLGGRLGRPVAEVAERVAGGVLVLVALGLAAARAAGVGV